MAAARAGGTGPSGQLSLRGCSQATVPSTLIRAGCHEADVDAQLGRIGVEKWAVYQPQAQLCKTAGCANHAARDSFGHTALDVAHHACAAVLREAHDAAMRRQQLLLAAVQARASSFIAGLEASMEGQTIVLVGHGDLLQIMQTAFEAVPASASSPGCEGRWQGKGSKPADYTVRTSTL